MSNLTCSECGDAVNKPKQGTLVNKTGRYEAFYEEATEDEAPLNEVDSIYTVVDLPFMQLKLKPEYLTKKKQVLIDDEQVAYEVLRQVFAKLGDDQEHFVMLCLHNRGLLQRGKLITSGNMETVWIDARVIFSNALLSGTNAVVLAHNHPRGHLEPSTADLRMTEMLVCLGDMLNVRVLDHLICSHMGYTSLRAWDGSLFEAK